MNPLDRTSASPRLRELIREASARCRQAHMHKQRRRTGEGRFTIDKDRGVSGVIAPHHPRTVYLNVFARDLSVNEDNFIDLSEAIADRAPTPLDAEVVRSLTWPLVAEWREMLLREAAL